LIRRKESFNDQICPFKHKIFLYGDVCSHLGKLLFGLIVRRRSKLSVRCELFIEGRGIDFVPSLSALTQKQVPADIVQSRMVLFDKFLVFLLSANALASPPVATLSVDNLLQ
jgi:hypothetical protein